MTSSATAWTYIVGIAVFVVSGLLLFSFRGAAIAASPVTLPLLLLTVWRHPTIGFQITGALIGGLTVAEVA